MQADRRLPGQDQRTVCDRCSPVDSAVDWRSASGDDKKNVSLTLSEYSQLNCESVQHNLHCSIAMARILRFVLYLECSLRSVHCWPTELQYQMRPKCWMRRLADVDALHWSASN